LKIGFGILGFPRFRYFSGSKRLKLPECVAISVELVCRAKHAVHGKCQDLFQELSIFDPKPSNALACHMTIQSHRSMSAVGTKQTSQRAQAMSAFGGKADMKRT
jgi:hypothetical protein